MGWPDDMLAEVQSSGDREPERSPNQLERPERGVDVDITEIDPQGNRRRITQLAPIEIQGRVAGGIRDLVGRWTGLDIAPDAGGQFLGTYTPPGETQLGRDVRGLAGVTGAVQGLTLGHGDELRGLVQMLRSRGFQPGESMGDRYRRERDAARAQQDEVQRQNPGMYAVGQVAGSAPLAALVPGSPTTALGRIAQATAAGAGFGAAAGHGESRANTGLDTLIDTGRGAGTGAVTGLALSGGLEGVRAGLSRLGSAAPGMAQAAAERRLTASGVGTGEGARNAALRELTGYRTGEPGRDVAVQRAADALRPFGGRVPTAGRTAAGAETALREAERMMSAARAEVEASGARVTPGAIQAALEQRLAQRMADDPASGHLVARVARRMLDRTFGAPGQPTTGAMNFPQAHQARQRFGEVLGRLLGRRAPNVDAEAAARDVYGAMNDAITGAAERATEQGAGNWAAANRAYAQARPALNVAGPAARQQPSALRELATLRPDRAIGALIRRYGHGVATFTLESFTAALQREPQLQQWLGRYAAPLVRAASQGPAAVAAAMHILRQRHPDFRQRMDRMTAAVEQEGDTEEAGEVEPDNEEQEQ